MGTQVRYRYLSILLNALTCMYLRRTCVALFSKNRDDISDMRFFFVSFAKRYANIGIYITGIIFINRFPSMAVSVHMLNSETSINNNYSFILFVLVYGRYPSKKADNKLIIHCKNRSMMNEAWNMHNCT